MDIFSIQNYHVKCITYLFVAVVDTKAKTMMNIVNSSNNAAMAYVHTYSIIINMIPLRLQLSTFMSSHYHQRLCNIG